MNKQGKNTEVIKCFELNDNHGTLHLANGKIQDHE